MQRRIDAVARRVAGRPRPRVAFIEWVEPLMAGGNWMPELIDAAGGHNLFGEAGKHSDWMQWDELAAADPDVIIVAPCGYGLERCLEELPLLEAKPGWAHLQAVRNGRVYFADGNAYFNRPGPRLADSAEMLAEMLHPDTARARGLKDGLGAGISGRVGAVVEHRHVLGLGEEQPALDDNARPPSTGPPAARHRSASATPAHERQQQQRRSAGRSRAAAPGCAASPRACGRRDSPSRA